MSCVRSCFKRVRPKNERGKSRVWCVITNIWPMDGPTNELWFPIHPCLSKDSEGRFHRRQESRNPLVNRSSWGGWCRVRLPTSQTNILQIFLGCYAFGFRQRVKHLDLSLVRPDWRANFWISPCCPMPRLERYVRSCLFSLASPRTSEALGLPDAHQSNKNKQNMHPCGGWNKIQNPSRTSFDGNLSVPSYLFNHYSTCATCHYLPIKKNLAANKTQAPTKRHNTAAPTFQNSMKIDIQLLSPGSRASCWFLFHPTM